MSHRHARSTPARRSNRSRTTWLAGAATAVVAAAAALIIPFSASATELGLLYVALGDSYSAGVGAAPYLANNATIPPVDTLTVINPPAIVNHSSACDRSVNSYPALFAADFGGPNGFLQEFTFAACSGATTTEVVQRQVLALTANTEVVSLTIGGNDIKFADAMTECVKPNILLPDCQGAINKSLDLLRNGLAAKLEDTYRTIQSQAPNAQLKVLGYPKLFDETGTCTAFQSIFNPTQEKRIEMNEAAVELSQLIAASVADVGGPIAFIDVQPFFDGHGICGPDPFINQPSDNLFRLSDSYHPNARGYAAYQSAFAFSVGA